jgi:hypothetical protein
MNCEDFCPLPFCRPGVVAGERVDRSTKINNHTVWLTVTSEGSGTIPAGAEPGSCGLRGELAEIVREPKKSRSVAFPGYCVHLKSDISVSAIRE